LPRGDLPSEVCVLDYDGEAWIKRRPWPTRGCCAKGGKVAISKTGVVFHELFQPGKKFHKREGLKSTALY